MHCWAPPGHAGTWQREPEAGSDLGMAQSVHLGAVGLSSHSLSNIQILLSALERA